MENTHDPMNICGTDTGGCCLGTMYFGTKVPRRDAVRILDVYAECGGKFFDTANKYASWVEGFAGGESETLLGKWLKGKPRDRFLIASKVGFAYGAVERGLRREQILSECEKSLRRLGTDCIDLYFAHAQDELTPIEETLEAFSTLIRQGKIRAAGASNYDVWRLAEAAVAASANGLPRYVCLQQRHTLLQPVLGADFGTQKVLSPEHLDFCRRKRMAVMAYSPLLGGLYERKGDPSLPVQYDSLWNRQLLALLGTYAREAACTPTQLVLGWLKGQGVLPIVSTSRAAHLRDNMVRLPEQTVAGFVRRVESLNRIKTKY